MVTALVMLFERQAADAQQQMRTDLGAASWRAAATGST